ncbi:MAG: hypothetical protein DA407_00655 [Bacteroidetes bacterium]|nr:MAG: hypothetical protein DA407_00655 [Bacteroidota bacterium]
MNIIKIIINVCFITFTLCSTAQISFIESSASQNINVSHGTTNYVGGLSFFDFDGDGWDDLTFASGTGDPIYFFKNNNGNFSSLNLNLTDYLTDTRQINWVDIDNDGDNDLFVVSNDASNRLYENDGNMNFTDITSTSGISMNIMFSWGASWGDINNDGYLDLFLSNQDTFNRIAPNLLYRNNGNNTFTDVSVSAGIDTSNHLSFCASFFDYNNDGWQDIYVANDRLVTSNILYKNNGNGTFTDVSAASGTDISINAMSTTIDDYNYDGWLDIYVTNTNAGNYFLMNNGDETFTNIAGSNGTKFDSIAWGAVFLDADNDTDLDLYVSGSGDGSFSLLPSAFYENLGAGIYSIPSNAGFANDIATSYSNAIGDINNDGYPDISVINKGPDNNFLWTNNCSSNSNNNWLKVTLEGVTSNRMGIGSWIEISLGGNKQYRYTLNGEGYTSQNSNSEFFGLANSTVVDYVKVTWLSGVEDILYNVSVNQKLHIVESSTLSVFTNELENNLKVYPNPSNGIINVDSDFNNFTIEVFNLLGMKVYSKQNLKSYTKLDLRSLESGVYLLKAIVDSKSTLKKIVIN